jgi:hypothetical protein
MQANPDTDDKIHTFSARGLRWKRLRSITAPTFSINNLKSVIAFIYYILYIIYLFADVTNHKRFVESVRRAYLHRITEWCIQYLSILSGGHIGCHCKDCIWRNG